MWSYCNGVQSPARAGRAILRLEALDLRCPPSSLLDPLAGDPTEPFESEADATTQVAVASEPESAAPANSTSATEPEPADLATPTATGDSGAGTTSNPDDPILLTPPPLANATPQIVNFRGALVLGALWRFTGDVIDEAPGGLTIFFGGEPESLQGEITTTDANGHFDKSMILETDGSDNGWAAVRTVDVHGAASNIATDFIQPG